MIFATIFTFYWFLNSGFLADPLWLPIQAAMFTVITLFISRYKKTKLSFWFLTTGLFYVGSFIFEVVKLREMSVVSASTGFGILVIVILFRVFERD